MPVTSDNGLTFQANLTNPIPSGQLLAPVGSEPGLDDQSRQRARERHARAIASIRILALQLRSRTSVRRRLPRRGLASRPAADATCRFSKPSNYVPQQFRTQSPLRDAAAETFLTQAVSNPSRRADARRAGEATAPPSRGGGCSISIRSSKPSGICTGGGTFCTETDNGSNVYHGLILRADKAVHARLHGDELVYLVAHAQSASRR